MMMNGNLCRWLMALVGGALLVTGCRVSAPQYSSATIEQAIQQSNANAGLRRQLEAGFNRLHTEGRLVAPSTLLKDLPSRCEISLPHQKDYGLDGSELYQRVRKSAAIVGALQKCTNPKCRVRAHFRPSASGAFLTGDGVLVTNYHVINHTNLVGYGVATFDGQCFPVTKVLAVDRSWDLAILKVEGAKPTPLTVAPYAPVGTPIAVVSNPTLQFFTYSEGVITGYFPFERLFTNQSVRVRRKLLNMDISADYARGSSGGAVVDRYGRLVGLVESTEPIYYTSKEKNREVIQMVRKHCVPAHRILQLVGALPRPEDEEDLPESKPTTDSVLGDDPPLKP